MNEILDTNMSINDNKTNNCINMSDSLNADIISSDLKDDTIENKLLKPLIVFDYIFDENELKNNQKIVEDKLAIYKKEKMSALLNSEMENKINLLNTLIDKDTTDYNTLIPVYLKLKNKTISLCVDMETSICQLKNNTRLYQYVFKYNNIKLEDSQKLNSLSIMNEDKLIIIDVEERQVNNNSYNRTNNESEGLCNNNNNLKEIYDKMFSNCSNNNQNTLQTFKLFLSNNDFDLDNFHYDTYYQINKIISDSLKSLKIYFSSYNEDNDVMYNDIFNKIPKNETSNIDVKINIPNDDTSDIISIKVNIEIPISILILYLYIVKNNDCIVKDIYIRTIDDQKIILDKTKTFGFIYNNYIDITKIKYFGFVKYDNHKKIKPIGKIVKILNNNYNIIDENTLVEKIYNNEFENSYYINDLVFYGRIMYYEINTDIKYVQPIYKFFINLYKNYIFVKRQEIKIYDDNIYNSKRLLLFYIMHNLDLVKNNNLNISEITIMKSITNKVYDLNFQNSDEIYDIKKILKNENCEINLYVLQKYDGNDYNYDLYNLLPINVSQIDVNTNAYKNMLQSKNINNNINEYCGEDRKNSVSPTHTGIIHGNNINKNNLYRYADLEEDNDLDDCYDESEIVINNRNDSNDRNVWDDRNDQQNINFKVDNTNIIINFLEKVKNIEVDKNIQPFHNLLLETKNNLKVDDSKNGEYYDLLMNFSNIFNITINENSAFILFNIIKNAALNNIVLFKHIGDIDTKIEIINNNFKKYICLFKIIKNILKSNDVLKTKDENTIIHMIINIAQNLNIRDIPEINHNITNFINTIILKYYDIIDQILSICCHDGKNTNNYILDKFLKHCNNILNGNNYINPIIINKIINDWTEDVISSSLN